MTASWFAALFAWLLTAMLVLLGFVRWAAVAAMTAAAVTAAVLVTAGIAAAVRRLRRESREIDQLIEARRHLGAIIPPPPDLEFLGPEGGCGWCCDLDTPGDPRDCRCETPCQGIDWCNADGWTTSLIEAVKDGQHG